MSSEKTLLQLTTTAHMRTFTLSQVPAKGKLRRIFKQAIFGDRIRCPYCTSSIVRSLKREERWRCKTCRTTFSIKSCSWLKGSKLTLEQIWMLLWLWQNKYNLQQAMDNAEVSYPTAFNWYKRFREHIPQGRIDIILKNDIAADEMFVKKNCIIGAKQKGTRNIALRVLNRKDPDKAAAVDFLSSYVRANSNLFTDGSGIYKGIGNWHRVHHTYEVHSKWEFSLTAEIEGLWGVFRTFIRRMYHHVTNKNLEALVAEFCLRFRKDKIFESPQQYLQLTMSYDSFAL